MKRLGILHSHCEVHPQSKLPTSCVVLSTSSASRTIVHYRWANVPILVAVEHIVKFVLCLMKYESVTALWLYVISDASTGNHC